MNANKPTLAADQPALKALENFDQERDCFACGANNPIGLKMEFYSDGQTVYSWLRTPKSLCGWRNVIHGGIITTIMDETMSWTAHHLIKKLILTKSIQVQFLHPLYVEEKIQVEGRVNCISREREAELNARIFNKNGQKCAQAVGTFALLKPKTARRLGIIEESIIRNFERYMQQSG